MRFLAIGGVIGILGLALWFFQHSSEALMPSIRVSESEAVNSMANIITEPAPPLGPLYRNTEYGFSLNMPEGFTAQDLDVDENGAHTVVLQNQKGEGIQIYISSGEGTNLSADDVRAAIPDMKVTGEQDVEIGADNRGVAFMSDNEAFGGASREVWFYFRGNLYQISTYARLDPLLQAMFATWKFF